MHCHFGSEHFARFAKMVRGSFTQWLVVSWQAANN
jgi:hypothetical protein